MTFKVRTGDDEGRATHWWASFLADTMTESILNNTDYRIKDELEKHNSRATAINYRNCGDYIEFETEEDFTAFVLRWREDRNQQRGTRNSLGRVRKIRLRF